MKEMHSLLKRQIKRHLDIIDTDNIPEAWERFIISINESYWQMDEDRKMLERSLDLSSQELLEANSEMRAVFQTFPDLLFRTDFRGTILDYQTSSARDLHFLREGLIGKQIQDIFPVNVGKKFLDAIDTLNNKRSLMSKEFSIVGSDSEHSYEARLLPLLESQVVIIVRDITDRKRAEEALRQSEVKYRSIVMESIGDGYYEVDIGGNMTFVNEAALKIIGYSREELIGMNYRQHVKDEDVKRIFLTFNEVYKTGAPSEIREWNIIAKDGSRRNVELSVSLIKDAHDKPDGFRGIVRDITARKRAQEALRESEEKYRSLATTADTMYLVDETHRYLFMNERHLSRFGLPLNKIIGRPYSEFHSEKSTSAFVEKVEHVFETGISVQHEYRSERDGRYFIRTLSPVKSSDGRTITAVTVVSKDITERKQAEEALIKYTSELEDANAALKVLLEQRQKDKYELEEMVLQNVKKNVMPYLEKLKRNRLASEEMIYISIIESNIEKITSTFSHRLSSTYQDLTPREIQIANLIWGGMTTKDIANILNLSTRSIENSRYNIRSKLGLKNKKTNLHVYLSTFP
ncbi:MAG: PAS domain S-box protein [Syntrophaceae bacterium]